MQTVDYDKQSNAITVLMIWIDNNVTFHYTDCYDKYFLSIHYPTYSNDDRILLWDISESITGFHL